MIGETIGNYRVLKLLGRGGMGEVYLAEQLAIGTTAAIKVLGGPADRENLQRFFNEARAVSKVKHSGTVKVFDVGFHGARAYMVMELLEGESLSRRIKRLGRMSGPAVSDIGRQIASVLEAVHAAGIIHRDLKPDNIFLISDSELPSGERVKILDFGIAKLTGALSKNAPQTRVGSMGTPEYMAPEQWSNAGTVDARADVYSFGCVLFEMLTGRPPFLVEGLHDAHLKHQNEKPLGIRSFVPEMPTELDATIAWMLAKPPADRPTIREIGKFFEGLVIPDLRLVQPSDFAEISTAAVTAPNLRLATTMAPDAEEPKPTESGASSEMSTMLGMVAPNRPKRASMAPSASGSAPRSPPPSERSLPVLARPKRPTEAPGSNLVTIALIAGSLIAGGVIAYLLLHA